MVGKKKSGKKGSTKGSLLLADFVYKRLRDGLREGEFRPGDRLREADLADQLQVSRTPIREAIGRLVSDGLVEFAAQGVVFIELDHQKIRELYFLRQTLEGTAAKLAAQHASPDEIELMKEMRDACAKASDPKIATQWNWRFHKAIHDAAHNRYLVQALAQLSDSLALLPGTTFEIEGRMKEAYSEHSQIVAAIEAREATLAEELARKHMEIAERLRIRMMLNS